MSLKIIMVSLFLGLVGCATVESPTTNAPIITSLRTIPTNSIEHTVIPGETLWRISKKYNSDLDDILKLNKIHDDAIIAPGQKIFIPKTSNMTPSEPTTNFNNNNDGDFIWPAKGSIAVRFREKYSGVTSKGIDILTRPLDDVVAAKSGKVIFVGSLPGYGKMFIIDHKDHLSTVYCGVSAILVKAGDDVKQGMIIAKTGSLLHKNSGSIHFEIRKNHRPLNPLYFIN